MSTPASCTRFVSTAIRNLSGLLSLLVIAAFLTTVCFAQSTSTARLDGTVTDATGAIVPNAKITVTNTNTRQTLDTTSNASGAFALAPKP
jgi:hypothetical protein